MNISLRISQRAKEHPSKRSVVFSRRHLDGSYSYPCLTFKEFEERSSQMANFFQSIGITRGMRTLLFVRPCLDFSVITFALFKIGAVPVLIDPGMGIKNLLSSVKQVRPEALVGVGKVHWLRRFKKAAFAGVGIKVSLDRVGGTTHYLYEKLDQFSNEYAAADMSSDDQAAILFTSGGTGMPKGVEYSHGILNAQTDALQKMFDLNEKQVDLPGFPLFALFTLAIGMTSVVPDMDPTHPASCDPQRLVKNILDQQVNFVAGSPAIWEKVGRYCLSRNIQLSTVKRVVMFGAPVRTEIHQIYRKILPFGDTYTPYGATECLPVSLISGQEILQGKMELTLQGHGTCIGKAVPGIEIMIEKDSDIPSTRLQGLPIGQIGEIVVTGRQVTKAYFDMPNETSKAKVIKDGKLWHRMGDLGRMDHEGNLWFLGRKTHKVEVSENLRFYPIQIEAIFNQHPHIRRTALVSINKNGQIAPGLVIERHDGQTQIEPAFVAELKRLGQMTKASMAIKNFYLHRSFPVDVRHNIKIDRLKLSAWAQEKGVSQCQGRLNIT